MDEPIDYEWENMRLGAMMCEMHMGTNCKEKYPNTIYGINALEECFQDTFEKRKEYLKEYGIISQRPLGPLLD